MARTEGSRGTVHIQPHGAAWGRMVANLVFTVQFTVYVHNYYAVWIRPFLCTPAPRSVKPLPHTFEVSIFGHL